MTGTTNKPTRRKPNAKASKLESSSPPVNKARQMTLVMRSGQTEDQAIAQAALSPEMANASTFADYTKGIFPEIHLQSCIEGMQADIEKVNGGDLSKLEGMLSAQAEALNAMFNNLAKKSCHATMMPHLETYMRLALKAQAQCRATVEAIAEIKFPKSATFIRQANIAQQQQVNNGQADSRTSTRAHTHEKNITPANELLEASHGERLDLGTASQASRINSNLATVGAVNRAEDGSRKSDQ